MLPTGQKHNRKRKKKEKAREKERKVMGKQKKIRKVRE
jgi:hypothetical protein